MATQTETKEIPHDQWVRTLDEFSKQHQLWIVEVEVIGEKIGDQEAADMLPLVGISADVKDGESRIEVFVGGRSDAHLAHIIEKPKRVWLKEPDIPGHEAVAIESEDGTMTIVHFRHVDPDEIELQLPGPER
jgi:hypothetical protein